MEAIVIQFPKFKCEKRHGCIRECRQDYCRGDGSCPYRTDSRQLANMEADQNAYIALLCRSYRGGPVSANWHDFQMADGVSIYG